MVCFTEIQKFKQIWIWLVLIISTAFLFYNAFVEYSLNKQLSAQVVFGFSIMVLLFILFYKITLTTRITDDKVEYRFFPFHLKNRTILLSEIEKIEIVKYSPMDYGGWGIRRGFGIIVYSVSGNKGIKIQTKSKKILIGTQKSESKELIELVELLNTKIK